MQLNKPIKILIGLGTLWIVLYPILFIAVWLTMFIPFILSANNTETSTPFFMGPFFALFPLQCFTILLQFGLMAFYLIHVIKNTKASETIRIILGIGSFFLPYIALPVYYYLFIWRETPPAWAQAPAPVPI